jgi:Pretoxin HINT domain
MPRTNYIWDEVNDTLLAETDEAGNTIAEYTHEPGQFGPLISQRRNGHTYYHHYDGVGSTRALTDEFGNVTDRYTYTAFGEPVASSGTTGNPFGYKGALGYYVNLETSDVYVRGRIYRPVLSRYLSCEPSSAAHPASSAYQPGRMELGTSTRLAGVEASNEVKGPGSSGLVPQVPWAVPSPPSKCAVSGNAKDEGETASFCSQAENWGRPAPHVCGVCRPREIVELVASSSCCDLAIVSHRGGELNTGGAVSYCCGKYCRLLPNPLLEDGLKSAFRRCKPCRIILPACESGAYYSPLRDLAKHTGCIVCGQVEVCLGGLADLLTPKFRCVDSNGNQVMGPQHIPFDAAHLGYPPKPTEKPEPIPACVDPNWPVGIPPNCFLKGTLVAVPNGFAPVEDLKVGDSVLAFNFQLGTVVEDRIVFTHCGETSDSCEVVVGKELLRVTSQHPFYVRNKGWIRAHKLARGDWLPTKGCCDVEIIKISEVSRKAAVFNISVEGQRNYFVGRQSLLVHNK